MINMKKFIYIISSVLAFSTLTGCDDEAFLKEEPKYFYTPDNAFSTSSQVDQVLVSCYSHIREMYCIETNLTSYAFRSGNGTDMFDVPTIRLGNRFNDYGQLTPEHTVYNTNYKQWYMLIAKANTALYAAELPQITWASEEEKAYVIAQAHFFRAWAYRNLGELYGGVPIVTEISTSPRYDFARTSRVETYQFAIDELENHLNDFPITSSEPGRIVRGAAEHTLCQLYLDKGIALDEEGKTAEAKTAYEKSIEYGNGLIDGSVYSLMTERFGKRKNEGPVFYYANNPAAQTPEHLYSAAGVNIEGNVIWDMFQEGNQNYQDGNKEAIWCIQMDFDAYVTEDGSAGINYSRTYGPIFRDAMSGICDGSQEDVGGHGVCFVTPTMYTRDVVYEGKWGKDLRNSDAVFRRTFIGNNPKNTEWYGKVIPWSVLYKDGASQDVVDGQKTRLYPVSCKINVDYYPNAANGENKTRLFREEYIIRLAETVLLRAEAKMRAGDKSGAADDINMVRDRAKCEYRVTADDVNVDLILDERARELVYEETRWNTLLRMGGNVAVERIKKYAYWDYPRATLVKNFNLWPIPQSVIDSNKDVVLEQNPGW